MMIKQYTQETPPIVLHFSPVIYLTDEQFFQLCQLNRHLQISRRANGEIIIMSFAGSETGNRNFDLIVQLGIWAEKDGRGIGFDSSTGFTLPNGAIISPDAAWILKEKWNCIPLEQRTKFAPIAPDFVVELRSESDALKPLQSKMEEYINNGVSLGWLIDRKNRKVYIYRPQLTVECLDNPATISDDLLPNFVLNLAKIW